MNFWQQLGEEFADLGDGATAFRLGVRLLMAAVLGGMLGYQREQTGKAAGLRTHMLVSMGSALFMLVGVQTQMASADISRIIQGVVTGIGFLGAGTIIKHAEQGHVRGLTTAAGIWLTSAIGIAVGLGREGLAVLGTLLALLVLTLIPHVGGSSRP